jgi:hypothetical protein
MKRSDIFNGTWRKVISCALILGLAAGSSEALTAQTLSTKRANEIVFERYEARGEHSGRLKIQRGDNSTASFSLQRDDRLLGSGEVRVLPRLGVIEVLITNAEATDQVRFTIRQNGAATEALIGFDGLEAGFSANTAALRRYVDESKVIVADVQSGNSKATLSAQLARSRDLLKVRGDVKEVRARLDQSALHDSLEELASIIGEQNDNPQSPAFAVLRFAAGFLAPQTFLAKMRATAALYGSGSAMLHRLPAGTTANRLQPTTQGCDWTLQGACFLEYVVSLIGCVNITQVCIDECWFVPYCNYYPNSPDWWSNFDLCHWYVGDPCGLFVTFLYYMCMIDACTNCPDCPCEFSNGRC